MHPVNQLKVLQLRDRCYESYIHPMNIKPVIKILAWLLVGYLLLVGLMTIFQNQLIFYPSSRMIDTPARLGMSWSEHWIETSDGGVKLHGWLLGDTDHQPVVVYSHGNAGNISGRIGIAGDIARQGAAVFFYDYRGYGRSGGSPSEQGIYRDGQAVVNYLQHRLGISKQQMIFYGRSLGAAVAARQSAEFGGAGLVLDSAFLNGKEIAADIYPFIPGFLITIRFPVDEDLQRSDVDRVMIMYAKNDRIIGSRHGKKLYEIASANKDVRLAELEGGHNDSFNVSRDLYVENWKLFLDDLNFLSSGD